MDIKIIRLVRLKKQRQRELQEIEDLRNELCVQQAEKEKEVSELSTQNTTLEARVDELKLKLKELESKQSSVKKVEEFNALTKEMTMTERERISLEHDILSLVDKITIEEEILVKIKESLEKSSVDSKQLEEEIAAGIININQEGQKLKAERDTLAAKADPHTLAIYERLLKNKKDRVLVPIENRNCSGCHIALTAQHENLVRKGASIIFCEHCSRIHFWQESESLEGTSVATKRRRRKTTTS
ncbi:MAG: C4-type zinc ribbon domain-containing protein [Simkaniaceae bacterium]|nr:C4-type zinc ribbon domain-containing protein [Simkaniaceae bacterium]